VAESQPFGERSERHRLEGQARRGCTLLVGFRVADVQRTPGLDAEPFERDREGLRLGLGGPGLGRADDDAEVPSDSRAVELRFERRVPVRACSRKTAVQRRRKSARLASSDPSSVRGR
jgi:hypothetical protein